ncbi:uncharacterized protein LOC124787720 [Schistocerca piceifrons]|uniref:uncharacterized protein LOC124787720 n=1 Tax=Schistocerca piceifrons TaxID=274613 RepID=UPI001F5E8223|nr:uncharacterized protein LOC124787720 [Schistocerca piceifrons]
MYVYETNPNEIISKSKSLSNKMSSGLDEVPDFILKTCAHHIENPLAKIFNLSLKTGVFPDIFKIAKVTPMLKKGSSEKNIKLPTRVTVKKSKSTQTPIFEFLDCILKSLDQHKLAAGIFRDLSKAFDILDHNILLEKLERRGATTRKATVLQAYYAQFHSLVRYGIVFWGYSIHSVKGLPPENKQTATEQKCTQLWYQREIKYTSKISQNNHLLEEHN